MKIYPISATYLISLPFKYNSERGKLFHLIISKKIIISDIKKKDLELLRICTTKGDTIFTPKKIRVEVDSRYLSLEKLEKLIKRIVFEVDVCFHKSNILNTKKILSEFSGLDYLV
jgi:hypothetical protein